MELISSNYIIKTEERFPFVPPHNIQFVTVDFTIKKRINREKILNQQTLVDTYVGFGVEVLN
jgi:hypothetical protein